MAAGPSADRGLLPVVQKFQFSPLTMAPTGQNAAHKGRRQARHASVMAMVRVPSSSKMIRMAA